MGGWHRGLAALDFAKRKVNFRIMIANLIENYNGRKFRTILADPPWQFKYRTNRAAPEYWRLHRYNTMPLEDIISLPVPRLVKEPAHIYLWVPNALLAEGLKVLEAWGFEYKTNIVWEKTRRDGRPNGGGMGFYFRNTTELVLFGVSGSNARTLKAGRTQINIIKSQRLEHSRKPKEVYKVIEQCSRAPYLELFARCKRRGWVSWGDEADTFEYSKEVCSKIDVEATKSKESAGSKIVSMPLKEEDAKPKTSFDDLNDKKPYRVIKWRRGRPYVYEQVTCRVDGKVKTLNRYLGALDKVKAEEEAEAS